ncbi:MAG: thioredoxin domain-containing protein [Candidatus Pacebacteria bacterium]|nr:thioredoxin domain-containing protein [Candidatus Paceibacterota bacterium]
MNSDTKIISIIGIITVIVVIVGVMLAGSPSGQTGTSDLPPINVKTEALVRPDSLRVTGSNPKIQFVEFADFECPACAMLHPSLKKIKAEYGDKIDFVFRVIPIHSNSVLSASAVFAAREQGKMIEMHDIIFEKQDQWTKYGIKPAEVSALFASYAKEIGLNVEQYTADLKNNASKYKAIIDQDEKDATSMGITSTPTAIVNGKPLIRGVVTYEKLKAIIEAELNPVPTTGVTVTGAVVTASSTQ